MQKETITITENSVLKVFELQMDFIWSAPV